MNRLALIIAAAVLAMSSALLAQPTQEEVFRSIHQNVGQTTDPRKFFAALLALAGVMVLLAVLSQRKKRQATPRTLNHHGKLLKEICGAVHLRPAEMRQLKLLAEEQSLTSPLTLLLCPSLLAKAVKEQQAGKLDRKVIAQVARKLGQHR
jgi:hypothetical protein